MTQLSAGRERSPFSDFFLFPRRSSFLRDTLSHFLVSFLFAFTEFCCPTPSFSLQSSLMAAAAFQFPFPRFTNLASVHSSPTGFLFVPFQFRPPLGISTPLPSLIHEFGPFADEALSSFAMRFFEPD